MGISVIILFPYRSSLRQAVLLVAEQTLALPAAHDRREHPAIYHCAELLRRVSIVVEKRRRLWKVVAGGGLHRGGLGGLY